MLKWNANVAALVLAGGASLVVSYLATRPTAPIVAATSTATRPALASSSLVGNAYAQTEPAAAPQPKWATSATGRVEPKDGEVRISTQVAGKIDSILVDTNDKVKAGDLLIRLDDDDIYVKLAAARAEAGVRVRERNEEDQVTGLAAERRKVDDALADAERKLFEAHEAFDQAQLAGEKDETRLDQLRTAVVEAEKERAKQRAALAAENAKPGMPLPTRLESSLALARAELGGAEIALERTRIRAPADGTVLNVFAKTGEVAVPSPENTLIMFGDLTGLAVRAEVEERDATKVRAGQKVIIKADAFPDKEFTGVVTSVAQSLAAPRIVTRGPRRPNDVEVVEVVAALDGNPPLFTGMRVDVFFKLDETAATDVKTN